MRLLFAVAAVVASLAPGMAQELGRMYRIAVLSPGDPEIIRRVTLPELATLGFVQGKNLVVTIRSNVPFDELPAAARDLVADRPDLVIAVSGLAVKALAAASQSTPILMSFADDPVGERFVASLNRPGGNITGQTLDSDQQSPKRLELLHELLPFVRRFAVLSSATGSNEHQASEVVARGRRLGLEILVARASKPEEYEHAFAQMKTAGAEALVIVSDTKFARDAETLARFANGAGLPTACEWDYMARSGCLLSFGPDNDDLRRRTAHLAARILRGTPPSELPVEGPDRFELVLNLKTAKALGISVPPLLIARADEVIE